ncbi:MAG: hypothetical protein K2X91_13970 [Thermoleophilia bacterium]|nr:hypothetical protein [Thermoleophilia bacterium]
MAGSEDDAGARRLRDELTLADPDPTLERVAALAEYSQRRTTSHQLEQPFAWDAYLAAGGPELTPWRAFQAGLRAAAEWGARRG